MNVVWTARRCTEETGPEVSRADFVFCMTAIIRGMQRL
jgi:hypothetical protein